MGHGRGVLDWRIMCALATRCCVPRYLTYLDKVDEIVAAKFV